MDRATALARAEEFRSQRERLLAGLADGSMQLAEVLSARCDDDRGEVKLLAVLEALPGARKVATRRAMAELGLDERVRVSQLDEEHTATVLATFPLQGPR